MIRIGSKELNVQIGDQIQANLIESAFDSIGVVQELTKEVCAAAGIQEAQRDLKKIEDLALLQGAIEKKTEDYSGRHLRALENIAEGRKTGSERESDEARILAAFCKTMNWVLVAAKRCEFSSR